MKISETNIYNIELLVAELEHVRTVRGLECDWVSEDTLTTLCGIIKFMNSLQHLQCSGISSTSAQLFGDILGSCKLLYSVSLVGNEYGTSIPSIVLDDVKCCNNLRSLDMSDCLNGSESATSLFCDYKSRVNLHTLNLHFNKIGPYGAQVLSKVLVHCNNLRYLDLAGNDLGQFTRTKTRIEWYHLRGNSCNDSCY